MADEEAKGGGEVVLDGVSWRSSIGEENLAGLWEWYSVPGKVCLHALEKKEDALVDGRRDELCLYEEIVDQGFPVTPRLLKQSCKWKDLIFYVTLLHTSEISKRNNFSFSLSSIITAR